MLAVISVLEDEFVSLQIINIDGWVTATTKASAVHSDHHSPPSELRDEQYQKKNSRIAWKCVSVCVISNCTRQTTFTSTGFRLRTTKFSALIIMNRMNLWHRIFSISSALSHSRQSTSNCYKQTLANNTCSLSQQVYNKL